MGQNGERKESEDGEKVLNSSRHEYANVWEDFYPQTACNTEICEFQTSDKGPSKNSR